jgi:hypothetical protein
MTYEDAQRAFDNEGPEDYEYHERTDQDRADEAENEALRRQDREEDR